MRGLIWVPVAVMALAVPVAVLASSGERGFDGVVNAIETRYHVRATKIPFMGLVSFIARGASHGAAANLHVAEFEDFHADVDGQELDRLVEERMGEGWSRVVRETSKAGHEQTLVFMRDEGSRMGMFVVDKDGGELDVVQVSVDPAHIDSELGKYTHHKDGDSD